MTEPLTIVQRLEITEPTNRQMLHGWVTRYTGLQLPEQPCCPGHNTPLDFLEHSFLEQNGDPIVWACRGGGKTRIAAVATLLDLLYKPGIQIRILAGSLEQAQKMYVYLREMLALNFSHLIAGKPTQKRLRLLNGSAVEVLAQADASVRGQRVQKLRCDEVELFDPSIWQAAQLVTKTAARKRDSEIIPIRGTVEAISTMHLPGGLMQQIVDTAPLAHRKLFKWCVWDILEKCPPHRSCHSCPLWQDCQGKAKHASGFLRIDDLIAMQSRVSRSVWQHEMLCHMPRHELGVFPAFDRKLHVVERRQQELCSGGGGWIAGIDFGIRQFVCLLVHTCGSGNELTLYVADEIIAEGTPLEQIIADLSQRTGPSGHWPALSNLYCDVAGIQRNAQSGRSDISLLRNAGFKVSARAMRVEEGLDRIGSLLAPALGRPRLHIHPRCQHLVAALERYHRNELGQPVKDGVHDHCVDALRYAICGVMGSGWKVGWRRY